jgi:hypothetical protein
MSVHTGIQAPDRTDSHGHYPRNRLTCANLAGGTLCPKRIQQVRTCAEARRTNHSPAAITPYRHGPCTIRRHPIPVHRKQIAHWRCRPSQHDSDLPTEPVTVIDLPCTPEVTGIHLPWTVRRHRASPSDHADASDSAERSALHTRIHNGASPQPDEACVRGLVSAGGL